MSEAGAISVSPAMAAALDHLRRDSDRVFGSRRAQIVALTFQLRESSEVTRARVITSTGTRHIFVKTLKPRRADETVHEVRARLRRDFDLTSRVFGAMVATPDLRAVEPLACYEDIPCIVTREAPGVPLDILTGRAACWPASLRRLQPLEAALARVGRWVAEFQRVADSRRSAVISLGEIRAYIDERLQRLLALPDAGFTNGDRQALLAYIDRRAAEISAADLLTVAVHGDITPSNVMVAQDCVTVLDFGMTSSGSKYFDVSRLYTQLEFYTAKPQYRPEVMARLQNVMLASFDPHLRPAHPLFEISALQHVVCHYVSHARQPGRFPVSLYSRHQCRRHRRWLRERSRDGRPASASLREVPSGL